MTHESSFGPVITAVIGQTEVKDDQKPMSHRGAYLRAMLCPPLAVALALIPQIGMVNPSLHPCFSFLLSIPVFGFSLFAKVTAKYKNPSIEIGFRTNPTYGVGISRETGRVIFLDYSKFLFNLKIHAEFKSLILNQGRVFVKGNTFANSSNSELPVL